MNKLRCLIVDDEPIARQIVESFVRNYPLLESVGSAENAMDAKLMLREQSVDIIFLDINMPVMDGIGFLKTLKRPPKVIFTTAYKEYAVNAFDLEATDYLLKPFTFDRFVIAVDKAADSIRQMEKDQVAPVIKNDGTIFIKSDSKLYQVVIQDILYIEAYGNYTKVYTLKRLLMPTMTFNSLEIVLQNSGFLKTHRSFLVNRNHISHIEGNRVYIGAHEIAIGNNYRAAFLKACGIG